MALPCPTTDGAIHSTPNKITSVAKWTGRVPSKEESMKATEYYDRTKYCPGIDIGLTVCIHNRLVTDIKRVLATLDAKPSKLVQKMADSMKFVR